MTTQDDINAFTSACGAACFLKLAAQTNSETPNRMVKVATVNDLPDLAQGTILPGTIMFVESLNIPVLAQAGCWTGLDNRELRSDCTFATLWTWGPNTAGALGDSTTVTRSSPVSAVGGICDWQRLARGGLGAIRSNGTVWMWGCNVDGRVGDSTTTNRSSPVSVVGGITDWCQLSSFSNHTLAIRSGAVSGSNLWGWGRNFNGQLGINSAGDSRLSPVSVLGGFSDWCNVSVANARSLGVRSNGSAWTWGFNNYGSLGDGSTSCRSSPVSVTGNINNWCRVSGGNLHSAGVTQTGCAWSWGRNNQGQLGDNTTTVRSSPVSVVGGFSDWCEVSAGGEHSLALRTNGTIWSWGLNTSGQLGDGTGGAGNCKSSPVSVVGGITNWCNIAGASTSSFAIRTDGTIWAWGDNTSGNLGDNTVTARLSPVRVAGGFTTWCDVAAGPVGGALGLILI